MMFIVKIVISFNILDFGENWKEENKNDVLDKYISPKQNYKIWFFFYVK